MNEVDLCRMQEDEALGQQIAANLDAILSANGGDMTVGDLYRSIYKYTGCGPWLSALLHDGTTVSCDELLGVENNNVRALLVGSIVEGSDAEVGPITVDLKDYEDPAQAVAAFDAAVQEVNDEACALWDEAQDG